MERREGTKHRGENGPCRRQKQPEVSKSIKHKRSEVGWEGRQMAVTEALDAMPNSMNFILQLGYQQTFL